MSHDWSTFEHVTERYLRWACIPPRKFRIPFCAHCPEESMSSELESVPPGGLGTACNLPYNSGQTEDRAERSSANVSPMLPSEMEMAGCHPGSVDPVIDLE